MATLRGSFSSALAPTVASTQPVSCMQTAVGGGHGCECTHRGGGEDEARLRQTNTTRHHSNRRRKTRYLVAGRHVSTPTPSHPAPPFRAL
eukprot:6183830-Pleurochrysis_carterae.AAC.3